MGTLKGPPPPGHAMLATAGATIAHDTVLLRTCPTYVTVRVNEPGPPVGGLLTVSVPPVTGSNPGVRKLGTLLNDQFEFT